jgi:hypothetical protein
MLHRVLLRSEVAGVAARGTFHIPVGLEDVRAVEGTGQILNGHARSGGDTVAYSAEAFVRAGLQSEENALMDLNATAGRWELDAVGEDVPDDEHDKRDLQPLHDCSSPVLICAVMIASTA